MNCHTAHVAILTADPAELSGDRSTELSGHLAGCATCRSRAAVVLAAQRELGRVLHADPARPASAVRRLVAVADRRRALARRVARLVPLAAAAGVAGLLLLRRPPVPADLGRPPAPPRQGLSVSAPPGRNVVVLNSDTAKIVVVWFYQ
jgi:anti-sigma factor RsiW